MSFLRLRRGDDATLWRWRRRHNMDDGADEMIRQMPAKVSDPELWWGELNVMSRRALEKHNYNPSEYHFPIGYPLIGTLYFSWIPHPPFFI